MTDRQGKTLSWTHRDDVVELRMHREPCNEIGSTTLLELEGFADHVQSGAEGARAIILHSVQERGFCAGADLRELFERSQDLPPDERVEQVRRYLQRIHRVFNILDASPIPTIAAVHRVVFGGGFELALTCDMIVADKLTRFCFPELRLGLVPGFGGIPRLRRDLGNAVVRDLLLTGRSLGATRALQCGLVSQVAATGESLNVARSCAQQICKFDADTAAAAKKFIKPIPLSELQREIDLFCELFIRPAVQAGLKKFVEDTTAHPYLP